MPKECEIIDNRIMLGNNRWDLRDNTELWTFEFVNKMVEFAVEFLLFILFFMDTELQLAYWPVSEKEVDEDIIIFLEHSILYLYYFQKVGL